MKCTIYKRICGQIIPLILKSSRYLETINEPYLGFCCGCHEDSCIREDQHFKGIFGITTIFDVNRQNLIKRIQHLKLVTDRTTSEEEKVLFSIWFIRLTKIVCGNHSFLILLLYLKYFEYISYFSITKKFQKPKARPILWKRLQPLPQNLTGTMIKGNDLLHSLLASTQIIWSPNRYCIKNYNTNIWKSHG